MLQTIRRTAVVAATLLCATLATTTHAAADSPSAAQELANELTAQLPLTPDGHRIEPIMDTGSGGGPVISHASDALVEGPEMSSYLAAFAYGVSHPDAAPPGANQGRCAPSAAHPDPVVLVHGTWLNAYDDFAFLSPRLARAGFCVFTFNYGRSAPLDGGGIGAVLPGRYGVGRIEDSAVQLGDFIDRVRATTHADRVDIVAHSQGGPVAEQYLKFDGGADKVRRLVSFGATYHGTSLLGMATLGRMITNLGIDILGFYRPIIGPANFEQAEGSEFVQRLNADGDTVPGVDYTVVDTRFDEVMNPLDRAFLRAGPGATVHDIVLQDGCAQDMSDHLTMMYSPRAASIALHALDPAANPDLSCTLNPWFVGGGGGL
ncbi:alpha/beta fold hydrolase [Nocardia terpenica]|uniref:esterase/lipase family protein n=1 Tax=Nocardia terpenica TaxID=455432 RepID=UPI0018935112|nr:alpha/beta fold hydrolase [Nocardia terpenica]MBF6060650.1 alpha/beta fold hydrolase [Nocardia terpenica]MBF6103910.1 alpha/beta fold hydrolase [Nocardia terpenica]MBF6111716.1 alpha/beta fold hydrolase [Nocardia terpenica]MBF6118131.1 alpha/beta fold hydrolase [Nocardia terpenica]MBF6156475.1 alpha/beta fold hydrolase [Nocardia terpenica]